MNGKYFVIRSGEIIGVANTEEEAQELVDDDVEDSEKTIREDYELNDETSDEEVSFMVGQEIGYTYYEYIDLDEIAEDEDYSTNEGDEFSKAELEEWE